MASILVVDDEKLVRDLLRRLLELAGHQVCEAADGEEALVRLEAQPFDLMILDLFMPGQDGLETLMALRRQNKHLAVIAISGGGSSQCDLLRVAEKFGAARVLSKPFGRDELLQTVRALLPASPAAAAVGQREPA